MSISINLESCSVQVTFVFNNTRVLILCHYCEALALYKHTVRGKRRLHKNYVSDLAPCVECVVMELGHAGTWFL